jgi:hypothetical protein
MPAGGPLRNLRTAEASKKIKKGGEFGKKKYVITDQSVRLK